MIRCSGCGRLLTKREILLSTPTYINDWALCDRCIEIKIKHNYEIAPRIIKR